MVKAKPAFSNPTFVLLLYLHVDLRNQTGPHKAGKISGLGRVRSDNDEPSQKLRTVIMSALAKLGVLIRVLLWVQFGSGQDHGEPVVQVQDQGALKGEIWTSYLGRNYFAFKSIPFAKPPVAELRFQRPQDPGRFWTNMLNFTKPCATSQNLGVVSGTRLTIQSPNVPR